MFSKKTKKPKKQVSRIQIISLLLVISFFLGSILLIQGSISGTGIFSKISFDLTFSDAANTKSAIGAFDGTDSNTCKVKGWTYDPDSSRTSIWVHFYEGAPYGQGGKFIGGCQTNVNRPDVNRAYRISGIHGFNCDLPLLNQGEKNIYIHAIDISGGPNNVISGSPKKINCSKQQGQQTLTVAKSGTGSGMVTSNPSGINCGTTCSKTFPQNTSVTLTASPQNGNIFEKWAGDCSGTNKTCTVSLSKNRNVTATFKSLDSTLPAEFSDGGTLLIFAHQDDDVLWMLPFWNVTQQFVLSAMPATPLHETIVKNIPNEYYQKWNKIYGTMDVETYKNRYKKNIVFRQSLVSASVLENKLKSIISSSSTKRIVTHNNWGEYGHAQHRLLNEVVRKLAVQYKKDVWALSTVVKDDTYQDQGTLSLESLKVAFSQSQFYAMRQLYLDEDSKQKDLLLWTWPSGPNSYPYGTRTYIKLVSNGSDKTVSNSQIAGILKNQSSYLGPYDSESLFGSVLVRNGYCSGPKSGQWSTTGDVNFPISCGGSDNKQPICEQGFYLSKIGSVPDAGGAYTVYTCKTNTNPYPTLKEKGKLYGVGIVTMQRGTAVRCNASSPMTCGSDNRPVCESGFRLIGTGSITEGFTSEYYSCESTSESFSSPRKGGLYGYAVVVQNSNGSIRSCAGPRGEALQFPISCPNYNGVAECANGYRRFMIGTLSVADGSTEKYFSCESM